jgi:hypothetical protein
MHEYEIRVLQASGGPALITAEIHLNNKSAIRSGQKLANGQNFEVWRGSERLYPEAQPPGLG